MPGKTQDRCTRAAWSKDLTPDAGLDERYARTAGSTTTVILPDALGSTLNLIGPTGTTTAAFTYEPYGVATKTGTDDTQYRYTGREDDGMGLMYYRARYYHPRFGRFVSEDPIGLEGGYNLYGYVDGSPTNATDPMGENPWVVFVGVVAVLPVVYDVHAEFRAGQELDRHLDVVQGACNGGNKAACNAADEMRKRKFDVIAKIVKEGGDFMKRVFDFVVRRAVAGESTSHDRQKRRRPRDVCYVR